jgi:tripartite-type tricarboxylate transporter receptor subunit TctC
MTNRTLPRVACYLALLLTALTGVSAIAQTYPARPVKVVVGFPPGGATDIAARVVASALEEQWKQPFLVENRPGGAQVLGADAVKNAAPDGYTLLFYSNSLASQDLLAQTSINLLRDFQQIARICGSGLFIAVPADSPASTLASFIAYAKANPGKLNEATAGPIAIPEIRKLWLDSGANIVHVPYKGGAPALTALLAGEVQVYGISPLAVQQVAQAGKVKLIAYTDAERHAQYPNVQTIAEVTRSQEYNWGLHFALAVVNGVPPDLVARLNAAVVAVVNNATLKPKFEALGMRTYKDTPQMARAADEAYRKDVERMIAAGLLKPER